MASIAPEVTGWPPGLKVLHDGFQAFIAGCLMMPLLVAAEPPPPAPVITVPPVEKPVAVEPSEADKKAELEFLRQIEATINKGDGTFLHKNFNYTKLLECATSSLPASEADRQAFMDRTRMNFNSGRRLALLVSRHNGRMHFLRVRTVDGQRRAIFRLNVESLIFYLDFVIEKERFDEYKVVDLFEYADNQHASQELTRQFRMVIACTNPEVLAKLPDDERLITEYLAKIQNIDAAIERDDWVEAARQFRVLPDEVRQTRDGMIIRIVIAQFFDRSDYPAALEEFVKSFPDDPACRVMMIDRGFLKKNYAMALQGIDAAEKWIGGDAELELLRGWAWLQQEKFEQAKDCAMKAVEHEKDNRLAYLILVALAVHDQQYQDALIWLDACKAAVGDPLDKEMAWPQFDAFRATPEYRNWAATRAK